MASNSIVEELTEEQFTKRYNPIKRASGYIWGPEELKKVNRRFVWVLVEDGEKLWAFPGYQTANAFGYLVTRRAWEHEEIKVLWVDFEKEGVK